MAKIVITSEDNQVKEIELVKERVTIGRKAYNDIVVDSRAVSGQHATITVMLDDAILEDLGSTNGTFIRGEKVFRQKLVDGDIIVIANAELKYVASPAKPMPTGKIEVLSGSHKGKKLALNKPLTTIGKPGSAVMAVTYAGGAYTASQIDGEIGPSINGVQLQTEPRRLAHGDMIDLAGTRMTFLAR